MRSNNGEIVSFNAGFHDATTVYLEKTNIIYAAEEERFSRIKAGINPFNTPKQSYLAGNKLYPEMSNFQSIAVVHTLPMNMDFAREICPHNCETVSHHEAHAYGAYYTSGIKDKCLVVSLDGGGYSSLGRYYIAENGNMKLIHRYPYEGGWSPANLYSALTQMLGWKMIKDEGKVVGLAGNGSYNEKLYLALQKTIQYKDGNFYCPIDNPNGQQGGPLNDHFRKIQKNLFNRPDGKALLAYNGQLLFENLLIELFEDLHKQYPEYTSVVVSGGPFANVKANKKINELPWVKQLYVYPAMGDMGLALGGAIKKSNDLGYWVEPIPFKNLFLGIEYSNDYIKKVIPKEFIVEDYDVNKVAKLLDDNFIVGFFQGKFEYGPRALGARSIVMKVTEKEGFDRLNNKLGRDENMPFAPVVLSEYADSIFDIPKSKYTAEFMTICFDTKEEWVGKIPTVVHKCDNTARPQILVKENNPKFYELVDEYRKVSGLPILLNTSFNGHNEPIVNTPEEALKHLQLDHIDYLVIEDFLIYKK